MMLDRDRSRLFDSRSMSKVVKVRLASSGSSSSTKSSGANRGTIEVTDVGEGDML